MKLRSHYVHSYYTSRLIARIVYVHTTDILITNRIDSSMQAFEVILIQRRVTTTNK